MRLCWRDLDDGLRKLLQYLKVSAYTALALWIPLGAGETPPSRTAGEALRVTAVAEMAVDRAAHQATRLPNGHVLITGGCAGRGCDRVMASAEIFDPGRGAFRPAASMTMARASHAAIALADGRVLVTGGWTGRQSTATAEIYDPRADRWTPAGEMSTARLSHTAVMLNDGPVLMAGGGSVEIFNPATSRFEAPVRAPADYYLATRLADGRVLLTGGEDPQGRILNVAGVFNPSTRTIDAVGGMTTARVKHAAALLPDGRVLVVGGSGGRGARDRLASTEIYDPATARFAPGPDLRAPRYKIRDAVVALPSGAVLVAGGASRPELFDPAAGRFAPVEGNLGGAQMFATATLLESGDVLVAGGYDDRIQPSRGAWSTGPGPVRSGGGAHWRCIQCRCERDPHSPR
jgi:hypothetical protein